jgi:DNA-binding CsgD family transcriptional regulator/predicted ATPase
MLVLSPPITDLVEIHDPQAGLLPLRGREDKLAHVHDRLDALAHGQGSVVLVEGASVLGKSRLLGEALLRARQQGVGTLSATGDALSQTVPLGMLLEALSGGTRALRDLEVLQELAVEPDQRFWLLQELRARLLQAAASEPLLIALDELHWADPLTLMALRALAPRLAAHPICWLLARRSGAGDAELHRTINRLRDAGASTIRLERISAAAGRSGSGRMRPRPRRLGVERDRPHERDRAGGLDALSPAEWAVVELVATGAPNRAVAEQLFLSPHTVSSHLRSAFAKLGIRSRVELMRLVVEERTRGTRPGTDGSEDRRFSRG